MNFFVFSALASLCLGADADGVANPLLDGLVRDGVPMSDGSSVPLAQPAMIERLDAGGQAALLAKISAGGHPASELVRKSIFAPFVLEVRPLATPAGKSPGWMVDIWFVAYGNWEAVSSRDFLESLMSPGGPSRGGDAPSRIAPLAPEALEKRQIRVESEPGREDGYYRVPAELFDRVQLSATWRAIVTREPGSIAFAARIDPRFNEDGEFPNHWRPLVRDPDNPAKLTPGPAHVYASAGFYGKMTPLAEPAGAILVECHGVFEEPQGWFQGAPLLRSKLPMLVQEQVRGFRGRLVKSAK